MENARADQKTGCRLKKRVCLRGLHFAAGRRRSAPRRMPYFDSWYSISVLIVHRFSLSLRPATMLSTATITKEQCRGAEQDCKGVIGGFHIHCQQLRIERHQRKRPESGSFGNGPGLKKSINQQQSKQPSDGVVQLGGNNTQAWRMSRQNPPQDRGTYVIQEKRPAWRNPVWAIANNSVLRQPR